jgi:ribonuclease E
MSKEIYISSTPHETRLAIVEDEALTEIYYERENEYTLAGSIYNGRVTRVLPGMQSSFVDIGLERDAFLYITDFMEEAPDSDEFDTTSVADRAPRGTAERAPEASPGDRGGRNRRGGRDRNQDRNGGRQPAGEGDVRTAAGQEARSFGTPMPAADEEPAFSGEPVEAGELGEGAPGADGGRRWRGRRGRRRGRGQQGLPIDASREGAAPVSPELEPGSGEEIFPDIERPAAPAQSLQGEENVRNDRDRGRRDGQRRDGQRFDGPRREQRTPQAPRGFTPSLNLHGVENGSSSETGPIENAYPEAEPAAEPLILPGESLSKYRKDAEPQPGSPAAGSKPAATVTLAPPANLYTLAEGWDGGAVLPGETLRPRSSASRPEGRSGSRREFDRGPRRDDRRPEPAQIAPVPEAAVPVEEPVPVPVAEPTVVTSNDAVEMAASEPTVAPEPIVTPEPPVAHEPVEYEPAEASASYRVDPLLRSEYRQSAPVLDAPVEPKEVIETEEEAPETASLAHTITPAPDEYTEKLHSSLEQPAMAEPQPVVVDHEITSISAAGEMYSEPAEVVTETPAHPTPMEVPSEASPIHHEGAVHTTAAGADSAPAALWGGASAQEEDGEEENEQPSVFHASSIEELEDFEEEETLEGAADLGTMLREMSIDQITRTAPEIQDQDEIEDDFEEDDLDEDELEDQESYELAADLDQGHGGSEAAEEEAARSGSKADQEFFEGQFGESEAGADNPIVEKEAGTQNERREPFREGDRRGGRREGRRDNRRGRDERRSGSSDRERSGGGFGGHSNGRGRHSVQATNLPAISDLLKPGQEILVQIAKEPIAKKGARITSHIALPGRFLVFMPTVNHTGVSRKIESDGERRRLKEILLSEKGEASGGFIVRTAAEGASEEELRSDLRFLLNLWADIKARSESSKSPALIYHDLNLIERILRDQVTDNFSAIWVDSETEYERVLRFLQRFQPSLIRRVKLYTKETPLFEQFGITEEINKALRSKVWLKSGGSIVINQTEALVAIDINTGKFVGKTARLEDTIVKTNLDAIPEIVRQIRLRDLGGIIIIDFIDMDERKNRNRVMAALEEELKSDRAPSKVLQFNDFGLVAITRKRVKQSLERTLSTTCSVCQGTGMVKSPVTVCNDIYIEMRKMHKALDRGDVMLRVHPEVVKQLKSSGAKWLQEMEEMVGKTILVKSDPGLHPEQFDIH